MGVDEDLLNQELSLLVQQAGALNFTFWPFIAYHLNRQPGGHICLH